MRMTLSHDRLAAYTAGQLRALFPDDHDPLPEINTVLPQALERLTYCFSHIKLKYYADEHGARFNHLDTDQYAAYLYFLANSAATGFGFGVLAEKAYALNKALHGLDLFYEIALPPVFLLSHPVGTVIGRGHFNGPICIYQNVTIGANLANIYPTFGAGVILYGGAKIIGTSEIGDNTLIGAGAAAMDLRVPAHSIVLGAKPHQVIRKNPHQTVQTMFVGL